MKGLPNYTFPSDHLSLLAKFQMDISSKWQRKNILPSDSRSVFLNPLSVTFRFQPRLTVAVVLFSRPIVRLKTDDRLFIKISKTFEYYSKSLRNKSQMYVEGEKNHLSHLMIYVCFSLMFSTASINLAPHHVSFQISISFRRKWKLKQDRERLTFSNYQTQSDDFQS